MLCAKQRMKNCNVGENVYVSRARAVLCVCMVCGGLCQRDKNNSTNN